MTISPRTRVVNQLKKTPLTISRHLNRRMDPQHPDCLRVARRMWRLGSHLRSTMFHCRGRFHPRKLTWMRSWTVRSKLTAQNIFVITSIARCEFEPRVHSNQTSRKLLEYVVFVRTRCPRWMSVDFDWIILDFVDKIHLVRGADEELGNRGEQKLLEQWKY